MTPILLVLVLITFLLLLAVAAITPNKPLMSEFEIKRRQQKHDNNVYLDSLRSDLLTDMVSLQRATLATLLVLFALLSVAALGVFLGTLLGIIVALEYGALARFYLVRSYNQKLYDDRELAILEFVRRHQNIVSLLRSVSPPRTEYVLSSKAELTELVNRSHRVLSDSEKTLIASSLEFESKQVKDIMTPKSVVDTINAHEILGPLVLDGLHKTGHSRFPVINKDIDHVIGILYLRDMLTVDASKKHTAKAESAMSKHVYYIREDHTLQQALSAFLRTHHHLFIVINEFHETVGIITLEDTIEALLGRSIIDEFDAHDDMRAVATRQAVRRHSTTNETEV